MLVLGNENDNDNTTATVVDHIGDDFTRENVSDLRRGLMDPNEFFESMGLNDLKRRFDNRLLMQRGMKALPQKRQDRSKFAMRPKTEVPRPEDFRDVPF